VQRIQLLTGQASDIAKQMALGPQAKALLAAPSALTSTAIGGSVHLAAAVDTESSRLALRAVDGPQPSRSRGPCSNCPSCACPR